VSAAAVDVADLGRRLNDAGALVAAAGTTLDRGELPHLEPVVPLIEDLTRDLARLPQGQGHPLRPALVALLDEIARLSERLLAERVRIGARLSDAGTRRCAGEACRRSEKP
jgi:hypothetical protein